MSRPSRLALLTGFLALCVAAPLGTPAMAQASERAPGVTQSAASTEFSAQRRRHHSRRNDAAAIAAFAGIVGTIGAIAAAQNYDRGPAYYGYGGGYGYGPGYGGPGYHGYHGYPQHYGPGFRGGRYRGAGPGYGWQDRGGF